MADVSVFRAEELSEADAVEADWSVGGGVVEVGGGRRWKRRSAAANCRGRK